MLLRVIILNKTEIRHMKILDLLAEREKIEVSKLAEITNVSLVTIRKDLTTLEDQQLLTREQGYAQIKNDSLIGRRLLKNYGVKKKIAIQASKLIQEGDTIFIESGTCCNILASELAKSKKRINIITNSVFMAHFIGNNTNIHLILTGGDYEPKNMVMVGPITKTCIDMFHVKYFFSGIDGYIKGVGFSGEDLQHVEVVKEMSKQADTTIVLVESTKFNQSGHVTLLPFDEVDYLFTDKIEDQDIYDEIGAHNIQVVKTQ